MQKIPVKKSTAVVLWDSGSNTNLVTSKFVAEAKLKLDYRSLQIDIPGSQMESTRMCSVPLVDAEGNIDVVTAAVVEVISQDVHGYPAGDAAKVFGGEDRRQASGGPIGDVLTQAIARHMGNEFDEKFNIILKKGNLIYWPIK